MKPFLRDQKRRAELSQASDQEIAEREYPWTVQQCSAVRTAILNAKREGLIRGMELSRERMEPLMEAMRSVEEDHFRTVSDSGSAGQAMLVWNALRMRVGLPWLRKTDLPYYDQEKHRYVMPPESNLLTNPPAWDAALSTCQMGEVLGDAAQSSGPGQTGVPSEADRLSAAPNVPIANEPKRTRKKMCRQWPNCTCIMQGEIVNGFCGGLPT